MLILLWSANTSSLASVVLAIIAENITSMKSVWKHRVKFKIVPKDTLKHANFTNFIKDANWEIIVHLRIEKIIKRDK